MLLLLMLLLLLLLLRLLPLPLPLPLQLPLPLPLPLPPPLLLSMPLPPPPPPPPLPLPLPLPRGEEPPWARLGHGSTQPLVRLSPRIPVDDRKHGRPRLQRADDLIKHAQLTHHVARNGGQQATPYGRGPHAV